MRDPYHNRPEQRAKTQRLFRFWAKRKEHETAQEISFWGNLNPLIIFTSLFINTLLITDACFLPGSLVNDEISETDNIRYKHSAQSSVQIHTSSGAHWFIHATGYEMPYTAITYKASPIFHLHYDIYNVRYDQPIERSWPAIVIGPVVAGFIIILNLFALFYRTEKKRMTQLHLSQYILIFLGIEIIFLLI